MRKFVGGWEGQEKVVLPLPLSVMSTHTTPTLQLVYSLCRCTYECQFIHGLLILHAMLIMYAV